MFLFDIFIYTYNILRSYSFLLIFLKDKIGSIKKVSKINKIVMVFFIFFMRISIKSF